MDFHNNFKPIRLYLAKNNNKATLGKVLVLNVVAQNKLIPQIGPRLKLNDCNLI